MNRERLQTGLLGLAWKSENMESHRVDTVQYNLQSHQKLLGYGLTENFQAGLEKFVFKSLVDLSQIEESCFLPLKGN